MKVNFEKLFNLKSDEELVIEFFKGQSSFNNDLVKINNVRFYPKEAAENERDSINGAIINSCKNKTWFEFYLDEIKHIVDSDGINVWKNPDSNNLPTNKST